MVVRARRTSSGLYCQLFRTADHHFPHSEVMVRHPSETTTAARHVAQLRRRRRVATAGTTIAALSFVVAAAVVATTVWELWGTGRETARAQAQLLAQLQAGVHTPISLGEVSISEQGSETSTISVADVEAPDPALEEPAGDGNNPAAGGAAWALIRIDDADGQTIIGPYAVVSGVTDQHLTLGPGHYPSTPDPGQPGNVGVAGHRTTYGAPFHDLGDIAEGAHIVLIDSSGVEHRYRYHSTVIVDPDQTEVLDPDPTGTGLPTVTLTTCHPKFSDRERLIVHGILVSST